MLSKAWKIGWYADGCFFRSRLCLIFNISLCVCFFPLRFPSHLSCPLAFLHLHHLFLAVDAAYIRLHHFHIPFRVFQWHWPLSFSLAAPYLSFAVPFILQPRAVLYFYILSPSLSWVRSLYHLSGLHSLVKHKKNPVSSLQRDSNSRINGLLMAAHIIEALISNPAGNIRATVWLKCGRKPVVEYCQSILCNKPLFKTHTSACMTCPHNII